jgi:hypothetical protein
LVGEYVGVAECVSVMVGEYVGVNECVSVIEGVSVCAVGVRVSGVMVNVDVNNVGVSE